MTDNTLDPSESSINAMETEAAHDAAANAGRTRLFYDEGWKAFWNGEPFVANGSSAAWRDGWLDACEAKNRGWTREEALTDV